MLEPQERRQLLDCLRPPEGYSLDGAVGTTYSLDLLALLTAPVAFTFFDWENEVGRPTANPHALLAAIRRNADRIALFCQAGGIHIPSGDKRLYSYLEGSIFQSIPPNPEGAFHPKVWFLRFTASDQPVRYRFLCLSRNLTFDRSWDTALVLEGTLQDRKRPFARNRPLSEFLAALPKLSQRPVPERVTNMIRLFRREILKVEFELPEGFNELRFWPLGIDGAEPWPFAGRRSDRLLVVSPFLSFGCLNRLDNEGDNNVLISRSDSLESLALKRLKHFSKFYSLSSSAEAEPDGENVTYAGRQSPLLGLHAKLFVVDQGWDSTVLTGSANATDAAFNRNVEFLTELVGKKSVIGIEALLSQEKGQLKLLDLLEEFIPGEPSKPDPVKERLERIVEDTTRVIAQAALEARVVVGEIPDEFTLQLGLASGSRLKVPGTVQIHCWPISISEEFSASLNAATSPVAAFDHITLVAITSFFAFHVEAASGDTRASQRFVLNLPLINAPDSRKDAVLRSLLQNREAVLKLFLMLLFGDVPANPGDQSIITGLTGDGQTGAASSTPLLECLMRALDRAPNRIEDIARLVEDLRLAPNEQDLLPSGFDKIWPAIAAVRAKLPT
jgi:hypothetical protein